MAAPAEHGVAHSASTARSLRAVKAPRVKVESDPARPGFVSVGPPEGVDRADLQRVYLAAFGTETLAAADSILNALLNALATRHFPTPSEAQVNGVLALLHGTAPRDEVEAMLIAQMIATHAAAMAALRRVGFSENTQQQDSNGNLTTKLLRTYAAQVEALHRYRSRGEQKVTVEHVHVHSGGQAIVGSVAGRGAGGASRSRGRCDA